MPLISMEMKHVLCRIMSLRLKISRRTRFLLKCFARKPEEICFKKWNYDLVGHVCYGSVHITNKRTSEGAGTVHHWGGGPLTTIVGGEYPDTIWLNIIESDEFDSGKHGDAMKINDADIFPWMAPTYTSENGRDISLSDVNPARVFWAVPRRIVVDYSQNEKECVCDICGCKTKNPVSSYFTKSYGEAYGALWRHPLTPYYNNKDGQFPYHVNEGGITYKYWPGFVFNSSEIGENALTIHKFHERRLKLSYIDSFFKHEPRIWFFGYDIHNNILTRCWYEGQMPLITVEEDLKVDYEQTTIQLVKISEYVVNNIKSCIKLAIFDPNRNVTGSFSFVESRFWKDTESEFYDALHELHKLVLNGENKAEIKLKWLKYLSSTALNYLTSIHNPIL